MKLKAEYSVIARDVTVPGAAGRRCGAPFEADPIRIPVISAETTEYAGLGGSSVLGWTIPGDRIVIHEDVVRRMSYITGMDPSDLRREVVEHEMQHNRNPYASEAGTRAVVAYSRASRGAPVSSLHSRYL